jgi:cytochrome c553
MRIAILGVSALVLGIGSVTFAQTVKTPAPDEPFWAWGWLSATDTRPAAAPADPNESHNVPGSKLTVTRGQITNVNPPDWFPEDHPANVPPIVAHGDAARMINACSFCHLPTGTGRIENAWISGLPVEYFVEQIQEFRNGQRLSSDPRKTNEANMINFAKAMTDAEVLQAATYFAQLKPPTDFIKVVESATVPKTYGTGGWLTVIEGAGAGKEPIGNRIVETPVSQDDQEKWRNPHSGFIAYVPPGSVAKGKQIVETGGGGKFTACTVCHGQDLQGIGPVPPLAGRSPGYLARQLYDMQNGNRSGSWTQLMAPVVAALKPDDMLNIAAYAASLKP